MILIILIVVAIITMSISIKGDTNSQVIIEMIDMGTL